MGGKCLMKLRFLSFILLLSFSARAQNLLVNGSFEEENICTEYHRNCAPEAWISTTLTSDYYFENLQMAHSGTHFTGIMAGSTRNNLKRSFIRSRLLCALRAGHQYKVEFYVRSRHNALDSIGFFFSNTDVLFEKRELTKLRADAVYRDTLQKTANDTGAWKKIQIIYTATGNEVFFAIGVFKKTERTFTMPADVLGNYYIFIDDVSFVPLDEHELLCADINKVRQELYGENERHEMLVRKASIYKNKPPIVEKPTATILLKVDTLIIPDILFATASAKLNGQSASVLDSFSTAMAAKPFDSLIVAGHTDSVGTLIYNTKLSADRAQAVADYLIQKVKFNKRQLQVRYHAYLHPVATNLTPQGRQRNRRVEIFLYRHE
jgi:outer membrane protein OmpA-like peptidoglycan-associated protein